MFSFFQLFFSFWFVRSVFPFSHRIRLAVGAHESHFTCDDDWVVSSTTTMWCKSKKNFLFILFPQLVAFYTQDTHTVCTRIWTQNTEKGWNRFLYIFLRWNCNPLAIADFCLFHCFYLFCVFFFCLNPHWAVVASAADIGKKQYFSKFNGKEDIDIYLYIFSFDWISIYNFVRIYTARPMCIDRSLFIRFIE